MVLSILTIDTTVIPVLHISIGRYMAGIKNVKHKALGTSRWKRLRLQILDRDDRICAYCGGVADTVDHIISRHDGGDLWDKENLISACKSCNSSKGKKAFFGGKKPTDRKSTRLNSSH